MAENKVQFGVCKLHFGTYEVSDLGVVTLGTPFHLPGTTSITLDAESEENAFWADNVKYWTGYSDNGYTGEITNALFTDEFKTKFMNYITLDDGGLAQIKGQQNKKVYMMFESNGDKEARRGILYNVTLGQISREFATTEDSTTPQTATLPFTVNGDNGTGIIRVGYKPANAAYDTLFDNPPVPALPDQSS